MSVTEKPTLAIIIGSIRPDRFGPTPAAPSPRCSASSMAWFR